MHTYSRVNIDRFLFQNLIFESFINYENMTNYANEYKFKIKPFPKKTIIESKMFPGKKYSIFGFMIEFKRHTKPYIYGYYMGEHTGVEI